jgi:hypothetical protein
VCRHYCTLSQAVRETLPLRGRQQVLNCTSDANHSSCAARAHASAALNARFHNNSCTKSGDSFKLLQNLSFPETSSSSSFFSLNRLTKRAVADRRSQRGGDCPFPQGAVGHQPVHMRDLQQGLPEGPEPAAPQERPQRPLEAARPPPLKLLRQARLCVPRAELRAPRPEAGARGPDRDQEALQPEARGEAVEVREVREEVRGGGGLEGAHQDLRAKAVHVRLWERLCEVRRSWNSIHRTSWTLSQ